MGLFSGKKADPPRTPEREQPPRGGTAHQRKVSASNKQSALLKAVSDRGRQLGMNPKDVLRVMDQAENEMRRRGQHPDQLPFGDPVADFDRYGI